MTESPIRVTDDGAVRQIFLSAPKGNILDSAMVAALTDEFQRLRDTRHLEAVHLGADGPHFSFGASVAEHLPDQVEAMLKSFHGLFRAMAELSVPLLASVRGNCLGGGLELVAFCHRVFASPDARLGQPEIQLGVFAPIASLCLPERIGRSHADHLCLSGEIISASRAATIGLVDEVAESPEDAAIEYAQQHFLGKSAVALRHATRAVRSEFHQRLFNALENLERQYLDELMATHDAEEGIRAFLDKRQPAWRNE